MQQLIVNRQLVAKSNFHSWIHNQWLRLWIIPAVGWLSVRMDKQNMKKQTHCFRSMTLCFIDWLVTEKPDLSFWKNHLFTQRFPVLALHPDSVHFQHFPAIHLQSPIYAVEFFFETLFLKQVPELILCEEVAARPITAEVEIFLQALPVLETKLC